MSQKTARVIGFLFDSLVVKEIWPMRPGSICVALSGLVLSCVSLSAQSAYATKVIASDTKNGAGGGVFSPTNALGAPSSSASAVHSLGTGGFLTLGFAVTITDGPGDDLIVFENPFASAGLVYSEAMFVEVSSNGVDFVRFPTRYTGPATSGGPFALSPVGFYSGFGGIKAHRGGVGGVDDRDVVQAGGDSFDLSDLATDPLVVSGQVNTKAITQVRLVDVEAGVSKDSTGRIIQDPSSGSADVNAVAVIHHTGNVVGTGPRIEVDMPANGNFKLTISDPQGIADLDPTSLRMSLNGDEIPVGILIQVMTIQSISANSVTLVLGGALPPSFIFHFAASVKDKAGARSGQNRARQ